jgi:hypothetical protein
MKVESQVKIPGLEKRETWGTRNTSQLSVAGSRFVAWKKKWAEGAAALQE